MTWRDAGTYSIDEVKKCTDFAYFLAGGWGGGGSDPRIPYSRVRREYMVFSIFWPCSVRILPNHRIRRIRTEYLVFFTYYVYSLLVDRIPYSVKKQNTDRTRTEHGQNTVITKRPIVITKSTPPVQRAYGGTCPWPEFRAEPTQISFRILICFYANFGKVLTNYHSFVG